MQPFSAQQQVYGRPVLPPLPDGALAREAELQRQQQQLNPAVLSPRPQHLPTHIPAGNLEFQASEINSVGPYQGPIPGSPSVYSSASSYTNGSNPGYGNPNLPQQAAPYYPANGPPYARQSVCSPAPSAHSGYSNMPPEGAARPPPRMASAVDSFGRLSVNGPNDQNSGRYSSASYGRRAASTSAAAPSPNFTSLSASTSTQSLNHPSHRLSTASPVPSHMRQLSDTTNDRRSSTPGNSPSGKLAMSLPKADDLAIMRDAANDPAKKVRWAKEVFKYLERNQSGGTSISDPQWVAWVDEAVKLVLTHSSSMPPVPEALFWRAHLAMQGTFPTIIAKNPKTAFRDFEAAANAEYAPAWYRIGKEYEHFNDIERARDAYAKGIGLGDVTSTYRMGMAYLLGQLDLVPDVRTGLDYLHTSAMIAEQVADPDTAAPLYVWGMILAGEFEAPSVPASALPRDIPEAGRCMKKAAWLNHAPALLKMGSAAEFAQLGCPFDPFVSVQYYSLASQQGDSEADMALSKWFLCGAEGCFSANEDLAFTFADKAARKGLATAEFALGYYLELGIGCRKDIEAAKKWYSKALAQGNEDARGRLDTLEAGAKPMSRNEHEAQAALLVRKRTQAQLKSDTDSRVAFGIGRPPINQQGSGAQEMARKQTMKRVEKAAKMSMPAPSPPKATPNKRYTLSDSAPPPQIQPVVSAAPVQVAASKKGPATFAEMGIQSTQLKKDECVVS